MGHYVAGNDVVGLLIRKKRITDTFSLRDNPVIVKYRIK